MIVLPGIVSSGIGQGARFMSLDWVAAAIRRSLGFDPYPGTLNVRLVEADIVVRWRDVAKRGPLRLMPASPEQCGARLVPITLAWETPAAVIVPDVTRHEDDVLEIIAAVHLRSRFALQDGDVLNVTIHVDQVLE